MCFDRPVAAKKNGHVGRVDMVQSSGSHSICERNRHGYEACRSLDDSGLTKPPTSLPAATASASIWLSNRAQLDGRSPGGSVVRTLFNFRAIHRPAPGRLPEHRRIRL